MCFCAVRCVDPCDTDVSCYVCVYISALQMHFWGFFNFERFGDLLARIVEYCMKGCAFFFWREVEWNELVT